MRRTIDILDRSNPKLENEAKRDLEQSEKQHKDFLNSLEEVRNTHPNLFSKLSQFKEILDMNGVPVRERYGEYKEEVPIMAKRPQEARAFI